MNNKKIAVDSCSPLTEALVACKSLAGYMLLFGLICNFLSLATSIYSMQVLDRVLSSQNMDTLLMLTIIILFSIMILSLIQGARRFIMNHVGIWLEHKISPIILRCTFSTSFNAKLGGSTQQLRDLQTLKNYIVSPYLISIIDIPCSIIFIIVSFLLHPYIGYLATIAGSIIIAIGVISDKYTAPLLNASQDEYLKSMEYVNQSARNTEAVQAMGIFPNIFKSWQRINKGVQSTQQLLIYRQIFFEELTTFIRTAAQVAVTCLGAYLVVKTELSSGGMIASSTIVSKALQPFQVAITTWKNFINTRKSYIRIEDGLKSVPRSETEKMSLPAPQGLIVTENVSYSIPTSDSMTKRNIVNAVTCQINPFAMTVIMGPSGCGKTTFIKMLVGALNPTDGTVRIEGANIADWNKYELGEYIGYLGQDIGLFDGTIRENIGRMNVDAAPEDIIEAAEKANVHQMILKLPNGYDTRIGSGGVALSAGQRQRIGLARAFYKNPPILILDEPNSNLDIIGDEALNNALLNVKSTGKTTIIVISHKPHICSISDYIMLMDEGAILQYMNAEEFSSIVNKK